MIFNIRLQQTNKKQTELINQLETQVATLELEKMHSTMKVGNNNQSTGSKNSTNKTNYHSNHRKSLTSDNSHIEEVEIEEGNDDNIYNVSRTSQNLIFSQPITNHNNNSQKNNRQIHTTNNYNDTFDTYNPDENYIIDENNYEDNEDNSNNIHDKYNMYHNNDNNNHKHEEDEEQEDNEDEDQSLVEYGTTDIEQYGNHRGGNHINISNNYDINIKNNKSIENLKHQYSKQNLDQSTKFPDTPIVTAYSPHSNSTINSRSNNLNTASSSSNIISSNIISSNSKHINQLSNNNKSLDLQIPTSTSATLSTSTSTSIKVPTHDKFEDINQKLSYDPNRYSPSSLLHQSNDLNVKSLSNSSNSLSSSIQPTKRLTTESNPNSLQKDRVVEISPNGLKTTRYSNGTIKYLHPDGTSEVRFTNGDVKKQNPRDGTLIYFYSQAKTTHTTFSDGTEVYEFPSGQV